MAKVSFPKTTHPFFPDLKKEVDHYFKAQQLKKTGNWKLHLKTLVLIPLALAIYVFLLAATYVPLVGIGLSFLLGLALVSIAFNIMHDACHGAYSSRKWVNELLGLTMNALGSNAYIWKIKHNVIHHTYTNIDGVDDDIAKSPVLRHCATQKWTPAHRFQHIYMFGLYALSTVFWVFLTDMVKYFSRKIVVTQMKLTPAEHLIFWGSKLLYLFFYIVLPVMVLGWQAWLIGYLIINITMGVTLSVVFQLAHVVEKTAFAAAGETAQVMEQEWAMHEVRTTANFAPRNKVLSWFVGGLNYQIEHHLFPRISHVHYPAISRIVSRECRRHGLPYNSYNSFRGALASHVRVMKALGKPEGTY
jgi:linoleoyl-CoA desaturase